MNDFLVTIKLRVRVCDNGMSRCQSLSGSV
jgi:hypothetical protein